MPRLVVPQEEEKRPMTVEGSKGQIDCSGTATAPRESRPADGDANAAVQTLRAELLAQQLRHAECLEQLTYAVTHDMAELLRMVRSYVQLQSRGDAPADTEKNEFTGYILDGTQRMEQMLSELVVYSRQFRPIENMPAPTDTEAVLEGVLLNLDRMIRNTQASVTHDPLPKVLCDSSQLGQLFRHLIVNAITFRRQEPPCVHISAVEEPNQAVFSVQDNGLGIDPRFHEQIFALFKRLHGRDYPGSGLGLAICKRIVDQYGGRIWVESEPDKGSTLRFTLPR